MQWAKVHGMAVQYIQPGKPNQNAYIERFNRIYREEVLDQHRSLGWTMSARPPGIS